MSAATKPPVGWVLMSKTRTSATGCWLWTGHASPDGYGRFRVNGAKQTLAHRACWEYFVGPIPEGMTLDHLCRERACINPHHMEIVSLRENILRGNATGAVNARKTHCNNNHPLSGTNLYRAPSGQRVCRTCRRENGRTRMRAWRAGRAA